MNSKTIQSAPLGRVFRLEELPGAVGKWLIIPPERLGVVIYPDQTNRTFAPGKRLVLPAFKRMSGGAAGMKAGYISAQSFPGWLLSGHLLSGDGQLLDVSLSGIFQVIDPPRFFTTVVIPAGTIPGPALNLSSLPLGDALGSLVKQYGADDLARGLPTSRLAAEAQQNLQPHLARFGLQALSLEVLSFRLSSDQAEIAEKVQRLRERLQQVELDQKMAEIENQAQLQDFLRQVEPGLLEQAGLRLVQASDNSKTAEASAGPFPSHPLSLRQWANSEAIGVSAKRPWLIERLFDLADGKDSEDESPGEAVAPRFWWLRRSLWMAFTLLVAYLLTQLVISFSRQYGWDRPWEVLTALWVAAIGILFESLCALILKQERYRQEEWVLRGVTLMDQPTGGKRKRIDALVRQQCSQDLNHARGMLNDWRARVYRSGREDLALKIRRLEGHFEQVAQAVQNMQIGQAPYLTDLKIGSQAWQEYLDYDEHLLVRTMALAEDVRQVIKEDTEGQFDPAILDQIESRLDGFFNRFENRSQALKASLEQQQAYRVSA